MTLKGSMLIYDYGTSSNALNEVFNKFVGELITGVKLLIPRRLAKQMPWIRVWVLGLLLLSASTATLGDYDLDLWTRDSGAGRVLDAAKNPKQVTKAHQN